jgi:hypothetical protein
MVCRGRMYSTGQKMNALEWLARYIEFLTPDCMTSAAGYLKTIFLNNEASEEAQDFINYEHESEVVPTIQ